MSCLRATHVIIYNAANTILGEAFDAKTQAEYDRLKNIAEEEFLKSIEPMEKAYELKPDEIATIETLRSLYFRFRMKSKEMEEKYEAMDKIFKEVQQ